ncbi:hypothetical protein [Aliikangiella maris]|uniref:Uncharacterized protein n=2 Tax=Aliikangiella maris TaxID=3162458 RepID=A0ABV3MPI0_9GAMM
MNHFCQQIFTLNQQILGEVENANWDNVAEKTVIRQQVLENFFNQSANDTNNAGVNNINDMLSIKKSIDETDQKVRAAIIKEKSGSIKASINLHKAHNAIKAYNNHHPSSSNVS